MASKYFVNSGHTISHKGQLFHAGKEIDPNIIEDIKKLLDRGVIREVKPELKQIDKAHSTKIDKVDVPQKGKVEYKSNKKEEGKKEGK